MNGSTSQASPSEISIAFNGPVGKDSQEPGGRT